MAWSDPSPSKRARPAMSGALAAPANPGGNMSFLDLLKLLAGSLIAGGFVYAGVHALVVEVIDPARRHPALDIAVPLTVAAIVAFVVLRFMVRRPVLRRARRGWDDSGDRTSTFGQQVAGDVVGAVIDAALD